MTDSTIFNGEQTSTPEAASQTTTEQQQSLTSALVGETQKYKTTEELAKAYVNADQFIDQLKEENRKLREQATSAKTIDEVLERIQSTQQTPQVTTPPDVSALKAEDVQSLVAKTLEQREIQAVRSANLAKADAAMKEKFGEKAKEVFLSLASNAALQSTLMEVAALDPVKFVGMFSGQSAPAGSFDSSSVATTIVAQNGNRASKEGTKEWATQMRKDNPSLYWSQEFQSKLQTLVSKNPSLYFGS